MTGKEGSVTYRIVDLDNIEFGRLTIRWDKAFVGANRYDCSVTPVGEGDGSEVFGRVLRYTWRQRAREIQAPVGRL